MQLECTKTRPDLQVKPSPHNISLQSTSSGCEPRAQEDSCVVLPCRAHVPVSHRPTGFPSAGLTGEKPESGTSFDRVCHSFRLSWSTCHFLLLQISLWERYRCPELLWLFVRVTVTWGLGQAWANGNTFLFHRLCETIFRLFLPPLSNYRNSSCFFLVTVSHYRTETWMTLTLLVKRQ